jgi:hypothetical protein
VSGLTIRTSGCLAMMAYDSKQKGFLGISLELSEQSELKGNSNQHKESDYRLKSSEIQDFCCDLCL